MQIHINKKIAASSLVLLLISQSTSFAKNGGGGNGGVGNCNGNGNVKHGCGSSVVTPDILTQTPQGNPRQPTAPIPTANQLPPIAPVPPPVVPHIAIEGTPITQMAPALPPPQRTSVETAPVYVPPSINMVPSVPPQMVPQPMPNTPPLAPPKVPQRIPEPEPRIAIEGTPITQMAPALPPPQRTSVETAPFYVPPSIDVTPPQVPQVVPPLVPPKVPPAVPPLVPPLVPQVVPPHIPQPPKGEVVPPLVPQVVPPLVPPKVPQRIPEPEPRIAIEGTPITQMAPALPPPQRTSVETAPVYVPPSINMVPSVPPQMVPQPMPNTPPLAPPKVPQRIPEPEPRIAIEGTPITQMAPALPPPQRTSVETAPFYVPPSIDVTPPQVPQVVPPLVPPKVPPAVPPLVPPLVPQVVPPHIPQPPKGEVVPPLVPQVVPPLVPPKVPQRIPEPEPRIAIEGTPITQMAPALPPPQRTSVETAPVYVPPSINMVPSVPPQMVPQPKPTAPPLVPPKVPQRIPEPEPQLPREQPPLPPQRVPDPVAPPPTTNVLSPGLAQPGIVDVQPAPLQAVPPMVPPPIAPPMVPQPKPTAPPLVPPKVPQRVPQMISVATPLVVSSLPTGPGPSQSDPKPQVEVTLKGSSAGFNGNMITNIPGRQPVDSYALFKNEATGAYRECIVSGLETRKVILPNGEVIYKGTLPGFRTVSNEVADIPSWHPHEAGCIISIEHRKKQPPY